MRARLTTGFVMVWCALAIASAASAQATSPASPPVTVLKAHRLFDGRGDTSIANGVVVVQGGKITAVGAGVSIPARRSRDRSRRRRHCCPASSMRTRT